MKTLIIDLHAHPQLKPLNASETERTIKGLWGKYLKSSKCVLLSKQIQKALKETVKTSQANLDQALDGNVRGIFLAMGPAERNFFKPKIRHILLRLVLPKKHFRSLASCITGFDPVKVDKIFKRIEHKKGVDYFGEELQPEYDYLMSEADKSKDRPKKLVIAGDYDEFAEHITKSDTITSVLAIEGAHALGNYEKDADFSRDIREANKDGLYNRLMPLFEKNIATIKGWGGGRHCPFFITLCHHFSNLLAGHSQSFSPRQGLLKPGMDDLLNQRAGVREGFSRLGMDVLKLLLSRDNGRRVLIDVKHMSVQARLEFYKYLEEQHWSKGDALPVICSHAAMSGYRTIAEADVKDTYKNWKKHYLSRQSINISDEEARLIAESDGLVGIVLHGGRLPGGKAKKQMDKARNSDQLRDVSFKLIMSNIFRFVRAVGDKKAWDILAIGSDMDGVIVPFETYPDYTRLGDLATHCTQFFSRPTDLDGIGMDRNEAQSLMYDFEPQELTDKIMHKNAVGFLEKYFHDGYLKKVLV